MPAASFPARARELPVRLPVRSVFRIQQKKRTLDWTPQIVDHFWRFLGQEYHSFDGLTIEQMQETKVEPRGVACEAVKGLPSTAASDFSLQMSSTMDVIDASAREKSHWAEKVFRANSCVHMFEKLNFY